MESHFVKTVNLTDWWLTKADNNSSSNTVAVAGIESAGRLAARVFLSAPIVQRLDLFTLKTDDGVFVKLKSLINKQRTCANGFSEEVFKYFLIGFPPSWETCAEKCLQQGIDSVASEDTDLNPDKSAVTKGENATVKLKQMRLKDSDPNKRPEHTCEAQEAVSELDCQDRDSFTDVDIYDSNVRLMEGVRYHLRNREVRYSELQSVHKGKRVNDVEGKPSSLKTDMTPRVKKSSKEKAEHPNFVESGGVSANHAKNAATISSEPISGEALRKNAGKDKKSIPDHSPGGKSRQSKKRRRNEETTTQMNTIMTRYLLQKSLGAVVGLESSVKSGGVEECGNNIEILTVRAEVENKRAPIHLRSKSVRIKKSTQENIAPVEKNVHFSPQDADKLKKSTFDNTRDGKSHSHPLTERGKQRSGLTRTAVNNKKFHDSARPILKTSTPKARSKAAVAEREGKVSHGRTPKLQSRRKLVYDQGTPCTPVGENKTPASQSSVLRTSRSGRLLLPTMEFWDNQLPIYDPDGGLSGIREGSTILKVKAQKGRKEGAIER